jgi:hypothetical protein
LLLFMSDLFLRTLSQALQAFTPIAVAFAWLRSVGAPLSAAIRRALLISIPVTVVAARLFQTGEHRALVEFALAAAALGLAIIFARAVWQSQVPPRLATADPLLVWSVVVGCVIVVVRQTMEIGALLETAVVELRSWDATSAIVRAATAAAIVGWLWAKFSRTLSDALIRAATRAFLITFAGQLALYALHESAEARFLPYSELLHTATEAYGPDGIYGVHFSELLVIVPLAVIGWRSLRSRLSDDRLRPLFRLAHRRAAAGMTIVWVVALMGMQRSDAPRVVADVSASSAEISASVRRPHILFRNTAPGQNFGRLSVAPLDALDRRLASSLVCERVSFASGHGLCLHTDRGVFNSHKAVLFDQLLKPGESIKLQGLPSRTRIARTGTVGAVTVFVLGEDYGGPFSTRTTIVDTATGDEIGELEQFTTWRDGARFRAVDFNFWGVTFSGDGHTFYASLRTAGKTYLVRGELALRKLTVVRDGVECPSLSPDNRLLGYKKRVGPSPDAWRLHVLDLENNVERLIDAEARYIDDQVEWLDSQHLLYAVPRRTTAISDVWVTPVDGTVPPRVFLPEASSPVVVR